MVRNAKMIFKVNPQGESRDPSYEVYPAHYIEILEEDPDRGTYEPRGEWYISEDNFIDVLHSIMKHERDVDRIRERNPQTPETRDATDNLIALLRGDYGVRVATLSKMDCSWRHGIRQGMTIVSLEDKIWRQYEPNTTPPEARLVSLHTKKKEFGDYVWVSMEPYPPSAIYKQDFESFLKALKFVDLIVFGKWNYDARARTEKARQEYTEDIGILVDFSRKNDVRLHVKSDTTAFAYPDRQDPHETLPRNEYE